MSNSQKLPPKAWWVFIVKPVIKFGSAFVLILSGSGLLLSQVVLPQVLNTETTSTTGDVGSILSAANVNPPSPMAGVPLHKAGPTNSEILTVTSGVNEEVPSSFSLAIPKLNISEAEVETNSVNLSPDTRLGHFRGSALPGDIGTAFIYGHSAAPLFFSSNNYKTIFSTLPNLAIGDEFSININAVTYRYDVAETKILNPEEVSPLKDYGLEIGSPSSVVLMTCYPPGMSTKRLLVVGKLVY